MAYATIERGASGNGYFAVPSEGSSFFISYQQFSLLGLYDTQPLTEMEFVSLRAKVLGIQCRQKAIDYLTSREHSRQELTVKLLRKNFPKDVIDEQLNQLEAERLLSDERFAEQFIISRQRKNPEGISLLKMRLAQKGVAREIAEAICSTWFAEEGAAQDALKRAAERILRKRGVDRDKLIANLLRKGFSYSEILAFLDEVE